MAFPQDPAASRDLAPGADPIAANADSTTPIAPPLSSVPTTKAVLRAGWVTGITAAVICLGIRVLGAAFRVDFQVIRPGTDQLEAVPWIAVFAIPLATALVGSLVAAIFLGVRGCRRWVFWLGTVAMVLSLASPLLLPDPVTWPTRIWLAVMHVVAWFVVVPQVARVVGDSDPRVTAGYREDIA